MKHLIKIFLIFIFVFQVSCQNNEEIDKLVEGSWQGTLGEDSFEITFIEGDFEGAATVTGNAKLICKNDTISYQIMNGTNDRESIVWFSLYKIPVVSKEDYHMTGTVTSSSIDGTYQKVSQNGNVLESGVWTTKRIN